MKKMDSLSFWSNTLVFQRRILQKVRLRTILKRFPIPYSGSSSLQQGWSAIKMSEEDLKHLRQAANLYQEVLICEEGKMLLSGQYYLAE